MISNSPRANSARLVFLKLGGSMITDKHKERIPRLDVMQRVAQEISRSMQVDPKLRVLVGNGAGSYGHVPASLYGTRQGVDSPEEWLGFSQVWYEAAALNRLVIDMLRSAGLPAVAFPPSAAVVTDNSEIIEWNTHSIQSALTAGLLPVVHGDVVFDRQKGGTILSTEDLFSHLAKVLHPQCILLAGIEDGVWGDYPTCTKLIESITPSNFQAVVDKLQGSSAVDVTGGMAGKVLESLKLVSSLPGMEVLIFSGNKPGNIADALLGAKIGTKVWNPAPDDAVSQI